MDLLILHRVVASLRASLCDRSLVELRSDRPDRYRLLFEGERGRGSALVSLGQDPWLGRPRGRFEGHRTRTSFAASAGKALAERVLEDVLLAEGDRRVAFCFRGGARLVAELTPRASNLIRLDEQGRVVEFARNSRGALARLVPGEPYVPARAPAALPLFEATADEVDDAVSAQEGRGPAEALRRAVFGLSRETAERIVDEARQDGRTPGELLAERVASALQGTLAPMVTAREDPLEAAEEGRFAGAEARLLPWEPRELAEGFKVFLQPDAAGTVGHFYEAVDRAARAESRLSGARNILRREKRKAFDARRKVELNLERFGDPERHKRWAEALLAGMTRAERVGEFFRVPDPYAVDGALLEVPAEPGSGAAEAADRHFHLHRRALRGRTAAAERLGELDRRIERLGQLQARFEGAEGAGAAAELEASMRELGIPVGLEAATKQGRGRARVAAPKVEGVRLFRSRAGTEILVGKGGQANDRLTFRLAGPEDFWLHAQGVPGAHVVLRNPSRAATPPREDLLEAAALAAYYCDSRNAARVDVQWTRRKFVRKPRNGAPGAVLVKRFETVRVAPGHPRSGAQGPESSGA